MIRRPYGVRITTVGSSPDGSVGNQRSARSTAPSGILAVRSRSTETSVDFGRGNRTSAAARRNEVLGDRDGGPGALAVRRVDQDAGDRAGAPARVEHTHPVVGEVDGVE